MQRPYELPASIASSGRVQNVYLFNAHEYYNAELLRAAGIFIPSQCPFPRLVMHDDRSRIPKLVSNSPSWVMDG
jgi:hypothetical protein